MDNQEAFYLFLACFFMIFLFTWVMLPPPLNTLGKFFQTLGYVGYTVNRALGTVSDANMCILADLYNLGGIEATVRGVGGEVYNISCALLSEERIAVTPADEEKFGEELAGWAVEFFIKDIRALNKLFYFSYLLMGFVIAAAVTDVYVATVGRKYSTGKMLGYSVMLTFGIMLVLLRTGGAWEALTALMQLVPAHGNLMANALAAIFIFAVFSWIIGEMAIGYHLVKEQRKKLEAMRMAARADYERGMLAMETARRLR